MDKVESIQYFDLYKFPDDEIIKWYKSTNYNCYRDELYRRYRRMFYRFSLKYERINPLFTRDDLLQECYFIFLYALDYYDISKNNRASFTTILFNLLNWKLNNLVRGITKKQENNYNLMKNCTSIYTPIGTNEDNYLIDVIEDSDSYNIPEMLFIQDIHEKLDKALNKLSLKQRSIIESRNGYHCESMSLEDLGDMFDVSRERIRQIEAGAMRALRRDRALRRIYHDEFNSDIPIEPPLTNSERVKKLRKQGISYLYST